MSGLSVIWILWRTREEWMESAASVAGSAQETEHGVVGIVVNNGDSAVATSAARDLGYVVLENPVNAGFPAAANQALTLCETEWALLLNADVRVEAGFVAAVATAARSAAPRIASLVPELRFAAEPGMVNARGLTVDSLGIPIEIDRGLPVDAPLGLEPLGGIGGCVALRVDAVRAVGGFEPIFFAYGEDVDLARRLARTGWAATFVGDAVAYHAGSASTLESSYLKTFLVARSRRLLFVLDGQGGFARRVLRGLTDAAHMVVQAVLTKNGAALGGRFAAFRVRRYAHTVARGRLTMQPCERPVNVAPRRSLALSLRMKLRTRRHMVSVRRDGEDGS